MLVVVVMSAAAEVRAADYDPPDAKHTWGVHDMNRPNPVKVTALPGRPPSDAVVLFDGTEESLKANWTDTKGQPTKWRVVDGELRCVPRSGWIQTKQKFGDCQLHVEWKAPKPGKGTGQERGNSGVFLMGRYEVQVLDSYRTDPSVTPIENPCYADGQAGAIYGQNPPLVNPARPEGEWQSYDVIFHQPVWEGDKLVEPGYMTLLFNGVVVQDHWPFEGKTRHRKRTRPEKHDRALPFQLQDHGNPVPYRNIWIRPLPTYQEQHKDVKNEWVRTK